jgi:hypothetical protein
MFDGQSCAAWEESFVRGCDNTGYYEPAIEYCCGEEIAPTASPTDNLCKATPCADGSFPSLSFADIELGLNLPYYNFKSEMNDHVTDLKCGDVQDFIERNNIKPWDTACEMIEFAGISKCGCPDLRENRCDLCEDDTSNFDPTKESPAFGQSCFDFASSVSQNSDSCQVIQATVGEYCGCSNPVARAALDCPFSGPGKKMPDPSRVFQKGYFRQKCAYTEYGFANAARSVDNSRSFGSFVFPAKTCSELRDRSEERVEYCCAEDTDTGLCPARPCAYGSMPSVDFVNVKLGITLYLFNDINLQVVSNLKCDGSSYQDFMKTFNIRKNTGECEQIRLAGIEKCGCLSSLPPKWKPCFSGETRVETESKGPILMKDLQVGDKVLAATGKYEQVYSFGYRHESVEAAFLQLLPSNLEISKEHMLLVQGKYVPASDVRLGDELEFASGDVIIVEAINTVFRTGVYAPFTSSGTIVVSNIKASNYIAFQDGDRLVVGGWKTPFTHQWIAHMSQSPHRIFSQIGLSGNEVYTADGMSKWVAGPYELSKWLIKQNGLILAALLVPAVGIGMLSIALERLLSIFV